MCVYVTQMPTRANIEAAMKWLVSDVRSGDALFIHYSGMFGCVCINVVLCLSVAVSISPCVYVRICS